MTFTIKLDDHFPERCALAVFLQGLVNKDKKCIFLDYEHYLDYLHEAYKEVSLEEAILHFKSDIQGIVIYDFNDEDVSMNMAASISAVKPWLGVPRTLYNELPFDDIPIKMDLGDIKGTNAMRQRIVFDLFKDQFDKGGIIHQVIAKGNFHWQLRDLGISQKWFTFFTDEVEEDIAFRNDVLAWVGPNTPIYGWNTDEIAFIKDASTYGCFTIPMDWSINHSYLHSDLSLPLNQKYKDEIIKKSNKHYLAIVVSDGDNIQWLERDFSTTSNYGQRMNNNKGYKMTWTVAPLLTQMSPSVMKYIYEHANQDYFISGVSGMGYINILEYPIEHLEHYAQKTNDLFVNANINVMCMLDNLGNTTNTKELTKRLDVFAKHENLKGGIWELDPDRYESGKGRVFWSTNGKPFISVRLSFWHPSNDPKQVDQAWIDQYVEKINSFPVSPETIDGYTVLNVHPWTTNMEELNYLVSKLANHVEIISAGEMITLVKENVKHINAIPLNL